MSAANGSAVPGDVSDAADKGKGKAVNPMPSHDMSMDEDEDSSDEESVNEGNVSNGSQGLSPQASGNGLLLTEMPTYQRPEEGNHLPNLAN